MEENQLDSQDIIKKLELENAALKIELAQSKENYDNLNMTIIGIMDSYNAVGKDLKKSAEDLQKWSSNHPSILSSFKAFLFG